MARTIPLASMEKILKMAGALRVGEKAKEEMRNFLEEEALRIGAESAKMSKHAGRKTLKSADIQMAIK